VRSAQEPTQTAQVPVGLVTVACPSCGALVMAGVISAEVEYEPLHERLAAYVRATVRHHCRSAS
jgi:hypothetical protein